MKEKNKVTWQLSRYAKISRRNNLVILFFMLLMNGLIGYGQPFFEMDKIVAPPSVRSQFDWFGDLKAVAMWGDFVAVGAYGSDINGTDAGAVFIYKRNIINCEWEHYQTLTATSVVPGAGHSGNRFGASVVMNENYIVVGSNRDDFDANHLNGVSNAGSAYIFEFDGVSLSWVQAAKIVPPAMFRTSTAYFGSDVDISGTQVIVGAYGDDNGQTNQGAAYIYDLVSGNWVFQSQLTAADGDSGDEFGWSVAIDNNYAIVGAKFDEHDQLGGNIVQNAGSAYIYENNSSWTQIEKIVSQVRSPQDLFGFDVDIEAETIIVGEPGDSDPMVSSSNAGPDIGSVSIFNLNPNWVFTTSIQSVWAYSQARFGYSIALEGNLIAVGAWTDSKLPSGGNNWFGAVNAAGAIYVFENTSGWNQEGKYVTSDRAMADRFGESIAMHQNRIISGASYEDEDDAQPTPGNTMPISGSAYIFETDNPASTPTLSISQTGTCSGSPATLSVVSGNLNGAANWEWYVGSCGGTTIGTGQSIVVSPSASTTYYVRGVGNCMSPGPCAQISAGSSSSNSWHQTTKNASIGDVTNDVITDNSGNVYVTGTFGIETTLNGGCNSDLVMNSMGNSAYVAKYDTDGNLLWEAHSEKGRESTGVSITYDNGIVYITGNCPYGASGGISFATYPISCNLIPAAISALPCGYVAAFDANTGCSISITAITNSIGPIICTSIAAKNGGEIFVGGYQSFGGGNEQSFIERFTPVSLFSLQHLPSLTQYDRIEDMTFDQVNNQLWVIGNYQDAVSFLGGFNISTLSTRDIFLARFEASTLTCNLLLNGNTPYGAEMLGLGIAYSQGNDILYLTGTFHGNPGMVLNPFNVSSVTTNTTESAFMQKIDLNSFGNSWVKIAETVNSGGAAVGSAVSTLGSRAYFTGYFDKNDLFIESVNTYPYVGNIATSFFRNHVYVACYNDAGNGIWGNVTTQKGDHMSKGITTDINGLNYVVGKYKYDMDYFSSNGTPMLVSTGAITSYEEPVPNGFALRVQTNGALFSILNPNLDKEGNNIQLPSSILNLNDRIHTNQIFVHPNPTSGLGVLKIKNFNKNKSYQISIYDTFGREILHGNLISEDYHFDLSEYSNGMYFLQVTDDINTSIVKVIKSN